jgi:hypothetical protein
MKQLFVTITLMFVITCASAQSTEKIVPQPVIGPMPKYESVFFVVNTTKHSIILKGLDSEGKPWPDIFKRQQPNEIAPGDTTEGGGFISTEGFGDPCKIFNYKLEARKAKWLRGTAINCKNVEIKELDPFHRLVFYHIRQTRQPFY